MSSMMQLLGGNFHINKVLFGRVSALWLHRHWPLCPSETKGVPAVRGKGLRVYLILNLSMFAQGVYICDMIQYMEFIFSWKHTNVCVFAVKRRLVEVLGWSPCAAPTLYTQSHVSPAAQHTGVSKVSKQTHTHLSSLIKGTMEDQSLIVVTMGLMLCNTQDTTHIWTLEICNHGSAIKINWRWTVCH